MPRPEWKELLSEHLRKPHPHPQVSMPSFFFPLILKKTPPTPAQSHQDTEVKEETKSI